MRFEKKEDCYLDIKTGLEWSLDNYGLKMDWYEAMDFCSRLNEGWRLPTIEKLFSLIDYTKFHPVTELPSTHSSNYWSSSTNATSPDYAWRVHFYAGREKTKRERAEGWRLCQEFLEFIRKTK